eukprot:6900821-Lingulodinium_polyedra.AAC.1
MGPNGAPKIGTRPVGTPASTRTQPRVSNQSRPLFGSARRRNGVSHLAPLFCGLIHSSTRRSHGQMESQSARRWVRTIPSTTNAYI